MSDVLPVSLLSEHPRHSRHLQPKLFIFWMISMSGTLHFPDIDPTFPVSEPDMESHSTKRRGAPVGSAHRAFPWLVGERGGCDQ